MRKQTVDYLFLFSVMALTAIGSIMVFSASPTMAVKLGDSYYFLKRHIFYVLLGFAALMFGLRLSLQKLQKWSILIFSMSIVLLLLVFIPGLGKQISGSLRWLDLAFFSFQPSEVVKFTTVLFLAALLAKMGDRIKDFYRGLLPVLALVGIICGIIIAQPDLGTAIAIGATAFMMLFAAGANHWHLLGLGVVSIMGAISLAFSSAYRLRRIVAFLNPWQDPQGVGFHIIQSLLAVGSGGFLGKGLGASKQKFFYLPQQFTDFIFAILCEELGFLGGAGVVALFILFTTRGLRIAYMAGGGFESNLAAGLVAWLTLQALINILVVVGLIPTTGIPLPFISYGGTATIINLFAVGIVLNISGHITGAKK
ncbi:MAG: putative lipid II flippase FtsW [Candidatus Margulisbacteria bacterium]|nr:putative lipid II flippase FtsW [Candidatus Margulisiibacteriota bacterium]